MAVNDRADRLRTFCALLPVEDLDGVRAALSGWDESPFARLPATHFARFVVIESLRRDVAIQPVDDVGPYLMFSAFFDCEPDAYLAALCDVMPDEAFAVWRHCRGCPGDPRTDGARLRAWLAEHRVAATAVFGAYPSASVAELREALAFRERFRRFAFDVEASRGGKAAFARFAEDGA